MKINKVSLGFYHFSILRSSYKIKIGLTIGDDFIITSFRQITGNGILQEKMVIFRFLNRKYLITKSFCSCFLKILNLNFARFSLRWRIFFFNSDLS